MKLSIIIPVFNEEKTIAHVLDSLLSLKIPQIEKEIIVVDDGSTDFTKSVISNLKYKISNIKIIRHKKNLGKGAAVRTGIKHATGDYILIQDADLEYNPTNIQMLLKPVVQNNADVVYGTRLNRWPNIFRDERTPLFFLHFFGNRFLSLIISMLYGQWLTDIETGHKLFPKKAVKNLDLIARGFEFEPEITSKLLKKRYKISEVSISTNPRGYKQGKKLNTIRDGIIALWTIIKVRFGDE